jgi:hypothetical protein
MPPRSAASPPTYIRNAATQLANQLRDGDISDVVFVAALDALLRPLPAGQQNYLRQAGDGVLGRYGTEGSERRRASPSAESSEGEADDLSDGEASDDGGTFAGFRNASRPAASSSARSSARSPSVRSGVSSTRSLLDRLVGPPSLAERLDVPPSRRRSRARSEESRRSSDDFDKVAKRTRTLAAVFGPRVSTDRAANEVVEASDVVCASRQSIEASVRELEGRLPGRVPASVWEDVIRLHPADLRAINGITVSRRRTSTSFSTRRVEISDSGQLRASARTHLEPIVSLHQLTTALESLAACVATAFGPTSVAYARGWTDYVESVRRWFRETAVQGEARQLDVLLEADHLCRTLVGRSGHAPADIGPTALQCSVGLPGPAPRAGASTSSARSTTAGSPARGGASGGGPDAGLCNNFNVGRCPGTVCPNGRLHFCNFRDATGAYCRQKHAKKQHVVASAAPPA